MNEITKQRKPRTTSVDNRLYSQIRDLSQAQGKNINDLLEEAMRILIKAEGVVTSKPSLENRKMITTSLDNNLFVQLRKRSIELGTNINDLLEEAMAMLLQKYGVDDPRKD